MFNAGVENLKSLGNLISWQKLAYDFGFNYNIEFECDAKVLILGEVLYYVLYYVKIVSIGPSKTVL